MRTKSKPTAKKPAPLWLHPKVRRLAVEPQGPFLLMPRGELLTFNNREVMASRDDGRTWKTRPAWNYGPYDKEYKLSNERSLIRTKRGTLIFTFVNVNEKVWRWRDELKDILPGNRVPNYVTRSTDGGKTWEPPTLLHEDWTGELRNAIQTRSGRVLLSSMKMLSNPGRHAVLTYGSDDEGKTWTPSNTIDLGGCGHHGGVTEATIEELSPRNGDGRILMLMRTNWGRFWRAISTDEGRSWRDMRASDIDASSAPGLLKRLASGRLILAWNRQFPEGKTSFPLTGGDGLWSEVPVSNHREELSIAFSEDEAESWSEPVVITRQRGAWLSYPRLLERRPGELWLTTMQGGLRVKFEERDFV
jgi:hypothetical protein